MQNENDTQYKKPELLKVGQTVRITHEAKNCGAYENWCIPKYSMIGGTYTIDEVCDDSLGVYYKIRDYHFPYYCVEPIIEEDIIEELTVEQLEQKIGHKLKIKQSSLD